MNEAHLDDDVERLERLYESGDYKQARRLSRTLDGDTSLPPEQRIRVIRIMERTGWDPAIIVAFAFTAAILIGIAIFWLS